MQIQNSAAEDYTESFRTLFLLEFTRELIRSSRKDLFPEKFSEEEVRRSIKKIGQEKEEEFAAEEKIKLPAKKPEEEKEKRFEDVFRFSTPKSVLATQR